MALNQQFANDNSGSITINAKWLDFSCFVMGGDVLAAGHPNIERCFKRLAQHEKPGLLREIQGALRVSRNNAKELVDTPYNRVESVGFHGPSIVGLDGKGITLKDMSLIVNVDYKYNLTNLDGVALVEQRNDVIDYLDIVLHLDELIVRLTGAYDYLTEIQ